MDCACRGVDFRWHILGKYAKAEALYYLHCAIIVGAVYWLWVPFRRALTDFYWAARSQQKETRVSFSHNISQRSEVIISWHPLTSKLVKKKFGLFLCCYNANWPWYFILLESLFIYLYNDVQLVCSPCAHKGFPPIRTPTGKTCKNRTFSCPSVTETDGSLGPRALRSYPLLLEGPGGRMVRDGSNAERTFHSDLRPVLCVCVSCVASIKYTCVLQCAACGNKELTEVSLVCFCFVYGITGLALANTHSQPRIYS